MFGIIKTVAGIFKSQDSVVQGHLDDIDAELAADERRKNRKKRMKVVNKKLKEVAADPETKEAIGHLKSLFGL
jgi:hypothetical protein